jgi:hypothetical protein
LKRGTLILTIIAGILVFLGVLVLYLPASWFASMVPPQVRCADLGGSIWRGECLGLTYRGGKLGNASWDLAPASAITGRLVGEVDVTGSVHRVSANIDLGFDGAGELRNVVGHFPLDPQFLPQFPRDQRGQVSFSFERLQLRSGGWPSAVNGKGRVTLQDFRLVVPQHTPLGSYELTFDGSPRPDNALVGQLRNLAGSPFGVEGTVTLTPPNNYLGEGLIVGHTADAERIVRQITFGARPDASGRAPFTFEGTF